MRGAGLIASVKSALSCCESISQGQFDNESSLERSMDDHAPL